MRFAGRDRATVVEVVLQIPTYGNPEQDLETARYALQAASTAFHGGITGKWKRRGEKTLRKIVLRDHG